MLFFSLYQWNFSISSKLSSRCHQGGLASLLSVPVKNFLYQRRCHQGGLALFVSAPVEKFSIVEGAIMAGLRVLSLHQWKNSLSSKVPSGGLAFCLCTSGKFSISSKVPPRYQQGGLALLSLYQWIFFYIISVPVKDVLYH